MIVMLDFYFLFFILQMVFDVEVLIPETLRRMYMVSRKHVHPNAPHSLLSRLFGDFKLIKGFDFLESGEEVSKL